MTTLPPPKPRRSWSRLIVAATASALVATMMLVAWSLGRLTAPHPVVDRVDAERVCVILDHGAGEHAPTEVTCWPTRDGQVQP